MALSNIQDRKQESKTVKEALAKAGIPARVGHGRGTAWGWLEVNIGDGSQYGEHLPNTENNFWVNPLCNHCKARQSAYETALRITQEVTGRHGEYNGDTNILQQDEFCPKCKVSYKVHLGHIHEKKAI